MGLLTATHTVVTSEGVTKNELLKKFLNETGLGVYGTATSGSVSLIGDTGELKSTQYDSNKYRGGWAHIIKDAGGAGAAPENEIRPITLYQPTHATDHITVNPDFTVAVAAGDEYVLWNNPNPNKINDLITDCLTQQLYNPCWTVLTEVPDGDMEQNNTTDWIEGLTATPTKVDSSTKPQMWGKRWLNVRATGANGYVTNANKIKVMPRKQYHLSALCLPQDARTDGVLTLWDETNGAAIDSITSVEFNMARLALNVVIPATCYEVRIRLGCATSGNDVGWDEVSFFAANDRDIKLPWWVKQKNQILGIFASNHRQSSETTDLIWNSEPDVDLDPVWYPIDNYAGGGLRAVNRYNMLGTRPWYILGIRNEEAYANTNTEKKYIDKDLFVSCLAYKVFEYLASPARTGSVTSKEIQRLLPYWFRKYVDYTNQQMESWKRIISDVTPDEIYVDDYTGPRY